MNDPNTFVVMPIPASCYASVCALVGAMLGGVPVGSVNVGARGSTADEAKGTDHPTDAALGAAAGQSQGSDDAGASQAANDGEIDAHGHPWSAELHASTKGKTKDGLWRMKVGVSRPDPLPGFPKSDATGDTGTSNAGTAPQASPSATSPTATDQASGQPATADGDEDEFAAFRAAAEASNAADGAAAASASSARQFSDADLGALCNQAAVKLGDPAPIKEIIAKYTPEGQVAHSRNIPTDQREAFAQEVEAKAGITFAA